MPNFRAPLRNGYYSVNENRPSAGRCPIAAQVVIGTDMELLRAWRCFSDFSLLAEKPTKLGVRTATDCWDQLDRTVGRRRGTDPASLRTEARYLGQFLTTLVEELGEMNTKVCTVFHFG